MNEIDLHIEKNRRILIKRFVFFSGIGIIGTAAHFTVLVIFIELIGVHPVFGSALGFVAGAFNNYYLNHRFTFQSNKRHREALTKFLVVAIVGFFLNALIMLVLVDVVAIHYLRSQIMATALVLIWNFAGSHLWVFKETGKL